MSLEVKGKIVAVPSIISGPSKNGNTWRKASIVVEYEDGKYPHQLLLSNMDKVADFSRMQVGMTGTFRYDGSVRCANNGNYYMDLTCWSWKIDEEQQSPQRQEHEDLPF